MKAKILLILSCLILTQPALAEQSDNTTSPGDSTSWSDKAKENASKFIDETTKATNNLIDSSKDALDKTGKAAAKGIDKTTKFINKTKDAAKEGIDAFKKKFNDDNDSK